jgi:hypothetical protein
MQIIILLKNSLASDSCVHNKQQQENLQWKDQFDFDNFVSILDDPNLMPYDSTFLLMHWIRHY